MKSPFKIISWIVAIAAAAFLVFFLVRKPAPSPAYDDTTTVVPTPTPSADQSISDGEVKVSYSSQEFGLAVNDTQVLTHSYIPPCDSSFDYCLYYVGTRYVGTNFESAGLRISKRPDLASTEACIYTTPNGSEKPSPVVATSSEYVAATYSPIGDAGAGHYANGAIYRVWYDGACRELETRIGETQFANYPAGSIGLFTDTDRSDLQSSLNRMINSVTLKDATSVKFPAGGAI